MFKEILKGWIGDLKTLILFAVIVFMGVMLFRASCENRALRQTVSDSYENLIGEFENLEKGVAQASQDDFLRYSSLYSMLDELPSSIKDRIALTDDQLRKIAKFLFESDTIHGGGEVTPIDSAHARFEDNVQVIDCYGNPVNVDRVDYTINPFKYEGAYVMTNKGDFLWLNNLTLDRQLNITDFTVRDKRNLFGKFRFAVGAYGDVDWNDSLLTGSLGPRFALGYNRWLFDIKKPLLRIDTESAHFDKSLKSWKFEINRDFWWK